MKLALISDIHGNYKALEAFLDYIAQHPADAIISLGDYVTDGPYPERTMALLYSMRKKYTCYMLRGNREDYLLNNVGNKEGWKPSSANGTLYYTSQHITEADKAFFASLPTEREVCLEGFPPLYICHGTPAPFRACHDRCTGEVCLEGFPPLYICHGTPGRVRGNVHQEEGLKEKVLADLPYRYLLGGHSHYQEIDVQQGKTYINPGSLGFAIDGVGRRAQFAILTGNEEGWEASFEAIPYDVDGYLRDFTESGVDEIGMTLNKAIKKSLVTGVNYFFYCILAMEAEAKEQGLAAMTELPETAWEKLAERFGL